MTNPVVQNPKTTNKSRQKLIDAARFCLLKKGYASTSVKDIAKKAGLNHGLIHHYFDSKENLYLELLLYESQITDQEILSAKSLKAQLEIVQKKIKVNSRLSLEFLSMAHEMPKIKAALCQMMHKNHKSIMNDFSITETDAYFILSFLNGLSFLNSCMPELEITPILESMIKHFPLKK